MNGGYLRTEWADEIARYLANDERGRRAAIVARTADVFDAMPEPTRNALIAWFESQVDWPPNARALVFADMQTHAALSERTRQMMQRSAIREAAAPREVKP